MFAVEVHQTALYIVVALTNIEIQGVYRTYLAQLAARSVALQMVGNALCTAKKDPLEVVDFTVKRHFDKYQLLPVLQAQYVYLIYFIVFLIRSTFRCWHILYHNVLLQQRA